MTAQVTEKLLLDGVELAMASCPPLPIAQGLVTEKLQLQRGQRTVLISTACQRGYRATWEISADRLYLNAIEGRYQIAAPAPLFADWVTAVLRAWEGEVTERIELDFGSVTQPVGYAFEWHLTIEAGRVTERRRLESSHRHDWLDRLEDDK